MHLESMTFEAAQRLKEIRRQDDEDRISSGAATAQMVQEQNSWFARPKTKKILNSKEVAKRVADRFLISA